MYDSTLTKICAFVAIAALIALFVMSRTAKPEQRQISQITCRDVGKRIIITGEVNYVKQMANSTFVYVSECSDFPILAYSSYDISRGDKIQAVGKIEQYNGDLELKADYLRVLK